MGDTSRRRHVSPEIWRAATARARRQHGVLSAGDLVEAGIAEDAVNRLARSGRLVRCHKGVYAVAQEPLTFRGHAMAALLACGDDAALSHRAACALHRVLRPTDAPIDVTSTSRRGARESGILVHEVRSLPEEHVMLLHGMRVTTPARTLLDLTESEPGMVDEALNEALVLRIVNERELREMIAGARGRRGVKALRAALDGAPEPTMSEMEDRAVALVRDSRFPMPIVNRRRSAKMFDLTWRPERVIVELDGFGAHRSRLRFEGDRARDTALAAQGWIVLRFTWARVTREPLAVIAEIAAVLALRRPASLD